MAAPHAAGNVRARQHREAAQRQPPRPCLRRARGIHRSDRGRRHPRTSAPTDTLLTRCLDQFAGAPNTLVLYRGYIRRHVAPLIGHIPIGDLDADILDSFYAELRRRRHHCSTPNSFQHHSADDHSCDNRCQVHICKGLGDSVVRHIHFLLSGAYKRAVRWHWVSTSPVNQAEPPSAVTPNPQPPTPAQAAEIVTEA